jgi:hypothetical protein
MEEKEMVRERQARQARALNPPYQKVRVYKWCRIGEGHDAYAREPAGVKYSADTLTRYAPGQKVFDAHCREWDCCSDWPINLSNQNDPYYYDDDDDDCDDIYGDVNMTAEPLPPPPPSVAPSTTRSPPADQTAPPRPSDSDERPVEAYSRHEDLSLVQHEQEADLVSLDPPGSELETQAWALLILYYGFTPPLPDTSVPESDARPSQEECDTLLRVLGLQYSDVPSSYFASANFHFASLFFDAILKKTKPPYAMYDLDDDCLTPIRHSPRFASLRKTDLSKAFKKQADAGAGDAVKTYFFFQPSPGSGDDRILVLLSAPHALVACRMPDEMSQEEVARQLLQYSIPFRLFTPSHSVFHRPFRALTNIQIPTRRLSHVFTLSDYQAYLNMRTLILGQPHMYAALRRGGIIWRLAIITLGPADGLTLTGSGGGVLSMAFHDSGNSYVEDGLSVFELDLLCGMYECISGKFALPFINPPSTDALLR